MGVMDHVSDYFNCSGVHGHKFKHRKQLQVILLLLIPFLITIQSSVQHILSSFFFFFALICVLIYTQNMLRLVLESA